NQVRNRILEELRVVQCDGVDLVVPTEQAYLVHDLHQVLLGEWISVDPGGTPARPEATGRGVITHAHEREPAVVGNVGQRLVRIAESPNAELRERDRACCEYNTNRDCCCSGTMCHHGRVCYSKRTQ